MKNHVPLGASFMSVSIIGLLVSLLWVWKYNKQWAAAFITVFTFFLLASIITIKKHD